MRFVLGRDAFEALAREGLSGGASPPYPVPGWGRRARWNPPPTISDTPTYVNRFFP